MGVLESFDRAHTLPPWEEPREQGVAEPGVQSPRKAAVRSTSSPADRHQGVSPQRQGEGEAGLRAMESSHQ